MNSELTLRPAEKYQLVNLNDLNTGSEVIVIPEVSTKFK